MTTELADAYCGICGGPLVAGVHARCDERAILEPPRYCARCARRMIVQVDPIGWRATCSRHGELHSPR